MAVNGQLMELLGSYDQLRHEIAANHVAEERAINATAAALIDAMVAALAAHQQEQRRSSHCEVLPGQTVRRKSSCTAVIYTCLIL